MNIQSDLKMGSKIPKDVSADGDAAWSTDKAKELYGIDYWGAGYFRINSQGRVSVTPFGEKGPQVDLLELVEDLYDRGIRPPILVRFPDIVRARIQLINSCFAKAIAEYDYAGTYQGVFPIKVNQQSHLINDIVNCGKFAKLGLEAGSKPELLIALAMTNHPDSLIISNGFKDRDYIETALLSQKLGKRTLIVVDRIVELPLILECARRLNMKPSIGFRVKLNSRGAGKWQESSGDKSKFGLTPSEIVSGIERLKKEKLLDSLELLHFHIGSQITDIQAIKGSLKEGAQFFAEISRMGVNLKYIDVGGGLGVDYDGSTDSESSVNYSEQEYANDVVSIIQTVCEEKSIDPPTIITESGRSLVAHHSILVFNVLGVNEASKDLLLFTPEDTDHDIIHDLNDIYEKLNGENLMESYNDTIQLKTDILQLFSYGYLQLEQRAKAENLVRAILTKMARLARKCDDPGFADELQESLSDTYFCNFSVFQSVPDSWAVKHTFPVMPLQRLNETPTRRAVLADLTCDSDGRIDHFIEGDELKNSLRVHRLKAGNKYYLGVFLVGAYQEILGDMHNLFGDTDAVHISLSEAGYIVENVVEGDTVAEVLNYVEYSRPDLVHRVRQAIEQSIRRGKITNQEARLLMQHYDRGLSGYTYLEDPDD
jgi:arginine decarboxylase